MACHRGGKGISAAWGTGLETSLCPEILDPLRQKRANFNLGLCVSSFQCFIYPYNSSVSFNPLTRKQETASKFAIEKLPALMMTGRPESDRSQMAILSHQANVNIVLTTIFLENKARLSKAQPEYMMLSEVSQTQNRQILHDHTSVR